MPKDHYDTLGVDEDASADEIKKSFRRLARRYHPDRNPDRKDAEERFKSIQEAYETLSNPEKRREYDAMRRNPFAGNGGESYYRSPDGNYVRYESRPGGQGFEDIFGGTREPGDFFSSIFGGRASADPSMRERDRTRRRGRDVNTRLELSFDRALQGGKTQVTLPDGKTVRINIPRGVQDGFKIRLRGRGERGPVGDRGDLYVTFRVEPHPQFRREGNNLYLTVDVPVFEAIFGTQRSITTAYGQRIKVTVPPGTQSGQRLRIREQGVRTDKDTGDLYVEVDVAIPRDLTDEQKDILRKAVQDADLL